MNFKKQNVAFLSLILTIVLIFSIVSFGGIGSKVTKNKGKPKGKFSVILKGTAKAKGKTIINYNAKKGKGRMKLKVSGLPRIVRSKKPGTPRFYKGWFVLLDHTYISTGTFNTKKKTKKGVNSFTFNPNDIKEKKGKKTGLNLSALSKIIVTKEAKKKGTLPSKDKVLEGKVVFKNNPYQTKYGSKLK